MITEIGIVAGEIWHYLDGHDEVLFSQLADGIDRPRDLALMSLGWLAR
ncbi:MAG: winged helix-turn-helix domain-containing protein, partial [Candidatus Omnitrophica bacterium]|nr:winged helix-turn-helix domain-containing protein [Candidatus Omnitrophota bacterium]